VRCGEGVPVPLGVGSGNGAVSRRRPCAVCNDRRLPDDDILFRSGDLRDQFAKLSRFWPNFDVLGSPNFLLRAQISDPVSNICKNLMTSDRETSKTLKKKKGMKKGYRNQRQQQIS